MQSTSHLPESIPTPSSPFPSREKSPLASCPCPSLDAALALPEAVQTGQDSWGQVLSEWREIRRILTLDLLALTDSIRRARHD